jgi:AGCS family alanine or glycine:cation symporter
MLSAFESLNQILWNGPILLLLCGAHLYFTLKLHVPQRKIFHALRLSLSSQEVYAEEKTENVSGLGSFASLATTLAATLGTGNLVGVSTAIALGGPGALFWCWITGLFGMATAYGECYLGALFRRSLPEKRSVGGPMYYLRDGLGKKGLAAFYALCVLLTALGVGCTTQSSAISEALGRCFSLSPHVTGIVTALLAGCVLLGGIRSIGNFCVRVVPFLGCIYMGCCLLLLMRMRTFLVPALALIFTRAFSPGAAIAGFAGGSLQLALRYGVARGLFTNEAGMGTTAMAAAAGSDTPKHQGLISMTAVFWDTVVMCAMTGLLIVSNMLANPDSVLGSSASDLTMAAFSVLPAGEVLLALMLSAFALTTIIGWCCFGETAVLYLFGREWLPAYQTCYILMAYFGAILPMALIWNITDLLDGLLVFPAIYGLFRLRGRITPP